MSDLKPCPFCGGEADYDWAAVVEMGGSEYQNGWVNCKNPECDASVDVDSIDGSITTDDLIRKWNTRVSDTITKQRDELLEVFDVIKNVFNKHGMRESVDVIDHCLSTIKEQKDAE